ncbi:MAG: class II fructose-1,6-bisphosphate aldolase [Clostridia bacterium]|nr:class II fructose-1,6-bisphosphate aldolase [Clostridia bacterium]MBR6650281.1 class II fructose-1,6-bisphosphate aldolase [Clostridia bacterium]
MYTTSKEMILEARRGGYAVPAFNAENLEMVQAIIEAAEEARSPVMIQTTPSTVKYITLRQAVAMVKADAEAATVPVSLHLDHCESYEAVAAAIDAGYSSVMIDASKLPYEENIAVTQKVVAKARPLGITVESELGTVGGKEDGHSADIAYTDPDEALDFFTRTGIDIFAIAIGTAHGFYKGEPKLNFELLAKIKDMIDCPLVLHGGSGIPDEMIKRTIELGINKVNYATELRAAATKAVREALVDESIIDPKKYMGKARDAVRELCLHKIDVCGSRNKI